jgi:DNA helicase-2/ATP-dependent DNA helicase PcrA
MEDVSQRKIIYSAVDENFIVIAPPGYGKTYTMARRISYLINNNHIQTSRKILGLTFTNAAAHEMYKKLEITEEQKSNYIEIETFHSLCYKMIRRYGKKIGLTSNFRILPDKERLELNSSIFGDYYQKEDFETRYEYWIQEKTLKANKKYVDETYNDIFKSGYKSFQDYLISNDCLDFNEILIQALVLWKSYPQILEYYQNLYQFILVDEFQDTNMLQYNVFSKLIERTFLQEKGKIGSLNYFICFGDPFQSIYLFQGAIANQMSNLLIDFDCIPLELAKNHRNNNPTISALNSYLRNDILPNKEAISMIPAHIFSNQDEEVDYIISEIKNLVETIPLHEICLISRTYWRLRAIKEKLIENDLDFLDLEQFKQEKIEENYGFLFKEFNKHIDKKTLLGSMVNLFKSSCEQSEYKIKGDLVLETFYEFICEFETYSTIRNLTLWEKLVQLQNDMKLRINWGEILKNKGRGKLFLAAIHQSKGREFEYVFIVGAENFFPYRNCIPCFDGDDPDIEEETNILYVALTRMKTKIKITSLNNIINSRGQKKRRNISCIYEKFVDFIVFYDVAKRKIRDYQSIKCFKS